MTNLLTMGAMQLAQNIKANNVSPLEVVEAHIQRLVLANPKINALIETRFEQARQEAQRPRPKGELPPLWGVPFTVKGSLALQGMSHSAGAMNRKGKVATSDATSVARLRQAGAIPLAITNVPEMAFWVETENLLYGRTNNPRRLDLTCGGSSGGEGAAIAMGGSPLGIASDAAGSIRIPAAFCGVCGHKPTSSWVPVTGQVGFDGSQQRPSTLTVGPMARTIKDLRLALQIMMGPDGKDKLAQSINWPQHKDNLKGKKVLLWNPRKVSAGRTAGLWPKRKLWAVREFLISEGAQVIEWEQPILWEMGQLWANATSEGSIKSVQDYLSAGGHPAWAWEMVQALVGKPHYSWPALMAGLMEPLSKLWNNRTSHQKIAALKNNIEQTLGSDGIILSLPYPTEAPGHHQTWKHPGDIFYTALFNLLEFPATVVPVGISPEGLSLTVQIAARCGGDAITLSVAEKIEGAFGGWRPMILPEGNS